MGSKRKARLAVIYHPGKINLRRLRALVELTTAKGRFEPTLWLPTSFEESGGPQAERAIAMGATQLLVVGGDGTIRPVIEVIQGTSILLGIVPVGTGNVLARNLRLPLNNLERSVTIGVLGSERMIDICQVSYETPDGVRGRICFSVMAGLGIDAKIMMNTDLKLKRRIGWMAYIDGGVRSLPATRSRIEITVDGAIQRSLKVQSLLIGNCGFLPGNISIMPEAKLDDGLLDVAVVGPRNALDWVVFWSRVTWQNAWIGQTRAGRKLLVTLTPMTILENLTGRAILVTAENEIPLQMDGDAVLNVKHAQFQVLPQAIRVLS
jgi:hypothetical protein